MTLREITYDLKMELQRNHLSDDSRLSNRRIRFWIKSKRYDYIKKRENKRHTRSPQIIQNLSPLETEIIDISLDPVNLPVGFSIIRTKEEIPQTIYFNELDDGIQSVGSIDQLQNFFTYVPYRDAHLMGNSKYNENEIFAFLLNGYMYIFGKEQYIKALTYLNVRGVFSDPMDLSNYTDQDGNKIFSVDHDYPFHEDMWEYMKKELVQTNVETLYKVPTDTTNDASDSYGNQ